MIGGIGVGRTAEEVGDLVRGGEEALCPADLNRFMIRSRRRVGSHGDFRVKGSDVHPCIG
jgi:hypothetical protein